MDENALNKQLSNIKRYIGTYASDELKNVKISFYPTFIIINLDERRGRGTHWIALAIYQNHLYICDSLGGVQPSKTFPQDFVNFLHVMTLERKLFITRQIQPLNSDTCGLYCITFIREMSRLNSFPEFIKLFSCNFKQNDQLIKFLNKI